MNEEWHFAPKVLAGPLYVANVTNLIAPSSKPHGLRLLDMLDAHVAEANATDATYNNVDPFRDEDEEDVFGFGFELDECRQATSSDLIGPSDTATFARLGLRCRKPTKQTGESSRKFLTFATADVQLDTFPTQWPPVPAA